MHLFSDHRVEQADDRFTALRKEFHEGLVDCGCPRTSKDQSETNYTLTPTFSRSDAHVHTCKRRSVWRSQYMSKRDAAPLSFEFCSINQGSDLSPTDRESENTSERVSMGLTLKQTDDVEIREFALIENNRGQSLHGKESLEDSVPLWKFAKHHFIKARILAGTLDPAPIVDEFIRLYLNKPVLVVADVPDTWQCSRDRPKLDLKLRRRSAPAKDLE
jgi:hypothetical protein